VKLAKYIHDLLLENETVIIPGFGAFISTYKPAEIGDNEIKPPSKEISFTRQIRNNDGMLVTAVARKAKISQPNALKRIERERENILYQLDKGENVIVENLGILFYDEKNEIHFSPFYDENLLMDSFGFQSVSTEDLVEETIEPEIVENVSDQEPEPDVIEIISEKIVEPEIESTVSETSGETIEEPGDEQKTKPIKLPEYKIEPFTVYPEKKIKGGWYWLLLIMFPVIVGGYFFIKMFSESTEKEIYQDSIQQTKRQKIIIQTITPSYSAELDSIAEKEDIETVKTETTENPILTDAKYYLVGGGFKKEENAVKYIKRLKEKEIEGFMLGKKGSLYLVGIGSFNMKDEAYNSLNQYVKKYPDWNLWVLEK
jgi:nucleoid DNA-binding protein/cell division septation protein DedD